MVWHPHRLAGAIYRWRGPLSGLILAAALALATQADVVTINNDLSAWVAKDTREYQTYERFIDEFGGTRNVIVALEGDVFSVEGLQAIDTITRAIGQIPLVQQVYSLATANVVRPLPAEGDDDGGIEVTPLLGPDLDDAAARARIRRDALDDPLLRGDLVSDAGRVTAIVVVFDERRIDEARGATVTAVEDAVQTRLPPGFVAHFNGSLEISETYNRVTVANTRQLTLPILAVTLLALYALFRSVRTTLLIAVAVGVSVALTMGLYAVLGFQFNVLTSMLMPLIVVLAIADDVHIVQHFTDVLRQTGDRREAFESSIVHLFAPLMAASATTALGLLSLATSDVVAVKTFGIGAALGVMFDVLVSLVLVPTLLMWMPPPTGAPPQDTWFRAPLAAAGRLAVRRAHVVLMVVAAMAVVAVAGVLQLRVDTNHINFFPADHPITTSAHVIDRELSGIYTFDVLVEGPAESMRQPDTLQRMARLGTQLQALPNVRKVVSLADYVKRTHQQLHGGAAEAALIADASEAVAQELFVFGLSDEGRSELARTVASDYSRARISVKLASMSSDVVFAQIDRAEQMARTEFAGTGLQTEVTGSGRIFATLDHYMVDSQLSSFATAFVTVFAVIFLVFRSMRFGLLSIVANVLPILMVMGVMGWLGISLNIATIMVASVTLGIVDDDTIHFISRYRREAEAGADTELAIELATTHEGRAALTTALINTAGFGLLAFSPYRPTAWFGGLLALTMAVAFLTEVLLVPALIAALPRWLSAPVIARRFGAA